MKMSLDLMVFTLEIIYQKHWMALYVKINEVIYFDSFGVEHFPK